MHKPEPCAVCGKLTTRFLFNDKKLGITVCSRKCEYEFIDSLAAKKRERGIVLNYLDKKIAMNKKNEKIGWIIAFLGLTVVIAGILLANATIFLIGVLPLTCGALSTRHFSDKRNILMRLRKRIAI